MRALFFILPIFIGVVSAQVRSIPSLKELPPVILKIDVVAPMSVGIGESDLRNFIERKLTSAGIKQQSTFLDLINAPRLYLTVTAPSGDSPFYFLNLELAQFLRLWRPGDQETRANTLMYTWQGPTRSGMLGSNGVPVIPTRDLVDKLLEEFIKDYREANPPAKP